MEGMLYKASVRMGARDDGRKHERREEGEDERGGMHSSAKVGQRRVPLTVSTDGEGAGAMRHESTGDPSLVEDKERWNVAKRI